jgi:hypothetical protein
MYRLVLACLLTVSALAAPALATTDPPRLGTAFSERARYAPSFHPQLKMEHERVRERRRYEERIHSLDRLEQRLRKRHLEFQRREAEKQRLMARGGACRRASCGTR